MDGNSKKEILETLRSITLDPVPLPKLEGDWIEYGDPLVQFSQVLEAVGGKALFLASGAGINTALEEIPAYRGARALARDVRSHPEAPLVAAGRGARTVRVASASRQCA